MAIWNVYSYGGRKPGGGYITSPLGSVRANSWPEAKGAAFKKFKLVTNEQQTNIIARKKTNDEFAKKVGK